MRTLITRLRDSSGNYSKSDDGDPYFTTMLIVPLIFMFLILTIALIGNFFSDEPEISKLIDRFAEIKTTTYAVLGLLMLAVGMVIILMYQFNNASASALFIYDKKMLSEIAKDMKAHNRKFYGHSKKSEEELEKLIKYDLRHSLGSFNSPNFSASFQGMLAVFQLREKMRTDDYVIDYGTLTSFYKNYWQSKAIKADFIATRELLRHYSAEQIEEFMQVSINTLQNDPYTHTKAMKKRRALLALALFAREHADNYSSIPVEWQLELALGDFDTKYGTLDENVDNESMYETNANIFKQAQKDLAKSK